MRIRIKFAKYDTMRYIGHLDLMRYVSKLFRRSGLPIKYTEGYHPHQILSFAQPLGLGLTSDGEYLDTELEYEMPLDEIKNRLEAAVSQGFSVVSVSRLNDREINRKLVSAMSLITRSSFLMVLKDIERSGEILDFERLGLLSGLKDWLNQPEIKVLKKSKKSEKEIELKQYIYEVYNVNRKKAMLEDIYISEAAKAVIDYEKTVTAGIHCPDYDNSSILAVSLCSGSETNIAPDFFLQSFIDHSGLDLSVSDFRIHRLDFYGGDAKGSVPLCQIP